MMTNLKQHSQERKEKMTLSLVVSSAVTLIRQCRISVKSLSHKTSHLKIKKNNSFSFLCALTSPSVSI